MSPNTAWNPGTNDGSAPLAPPAEATSRPATASSAAPICRAVSVEPPPPETWNPADELSLARKALGALVWLPAFTWQRAVRRPVARGAHLIVAITDHYEPSFMPRLLGEPTCELEQEARVERWCEAYQRTADQWRDQDGHPLNHTYFLPAEDTYQVVLERLAAFAQRGFGEIEIQLHHGVFEPDTAARTRAVIEQFRDRLVAQGCLSRWNGRGPARYGFVHGNWALANSSGGEYCGVDNEMQILAETGCYADFTLPSAPSPAQVAKINSIYEAGLPLAERAPHRRGRDLVVGHPPTRWPIIVQGPLALYFPREEGRHPLRGRIENGEISHLARPTRTRMENWRRAAVTVRGRPDWVFVKLHCHGLGSADFESMIGSERRELITLLREFAAGWGDTVHFASAREMVNIALAACDGREGDPSDYRDYRLRPITPRG